MEIHEPEDTVYSVRRIPGTQIVTGDRLAIVHAVPQGKKTKPVYRYLVRHGRSGAECYLDPDDIATENPLDGDVHD